MAVRCHLGDESLRAVGDRATVVTSGNGIDWSLELVPDSVTNSIFLGVGGTTNLLLAQETRVV